MKLSTKSVAISAASALALGLGVGGIAAAAGGEQPAGADARVTEAVKPATIQGVLENGKTFGFWSPRTPDDQRPDYMPVDTRGGDVGYLKVSEAFPPVSPKMLESSPEARELRAEYMASKIQPNDEGDVWAPVYAKDGNTVIDMVLISSTDETIE